MIIKKEQKKSAAKHIFKLLVSKVSSKKVRICFFIFIFLGLFIWGTLFGLFLTGFFGTLDEPSELAQQVFKSVGVESALRNLKNICKGVINENIHIPLNIVNSWLTPTEKLYLDIDYESYQKLKNKRDSALQIGYLFSDEGDFVPAKIRFEEETYDVDLRLKGDCPDHFEGDKWSYRIKVNEGKTILGMEIFSLQDPKTRNNIHEFVFQNLLDREGIISLRTKLVNVVVNGESKGIYQLQEHFEKRLIEDNERREGPIVRFNEDLLLQWVVSYREWVDEESIQTGAYYAADIDSFQTSKLLTDEALYTDYLKAKDLLELFRLGELKTSEVFDVEKLATFFAISALVGDGHGLHFNNIRFYYNPITSKLEPIAFDPSSGQYTQSLYYDQLTPFIPGFFEDMVFFEKYIQELQRVSDKKYIDNFFECFGKSHKDVLNLLYRENPFYYFDKSVYYKNGEYLERYLNPINVLKPYFYQKENGYLVLEVANIQEIPVKLEKVLFAGETSFMPLEVTILKPRKEGQLAYAKVKFKVPDNFDLTDSSLANLEIEYSLLGIEKMEKEKIYPWSRYDESLIREDVLRQLPNVQNFNFVKIDFQEKKIFFPEGEWTVSKNMIIPKGYVVLAGEDTSLNLMGGAKLISYSPLRFVGSEARPVRIFSKDGSGGIVVLNADKPSYLQQVLFENLRAPSEYGWKLTGAVTFNEADVSLKDCKFLNIDSEDALNIVRSNFIIDGVVFSNTSSDCFDSDFTKGSIKNSNFESCGNDGADFSGSLIILNDVQFYDIGDKAISFGENSQAAVEKIMIDGSYIGVASKDFSSANVKSTKIINSDYGLAAYQKKPEFGPASINVGENVELFSVEVKYLEEESSSINGVTEKELQKNVYEKLYPSVS